MCIQHSEMNMDQGYEMSITGPRVIETDNGVIYRHLLNNNQDIPAERTINAFKIAYDYLNKQIYPIRLVATSDESKAHIKVRFCEDGDPDLPHDFGKGVVAFAYKPRTDRAGEQYYNDKYTFSDILDGNIYLVQIIIHETLHSLGLPHNKVDEDDVLRPVYGKHRLKMLERTQQAFDYLYHNEYQKALPSALRGEKYHTITDEERKEKINNILASMQS